MVPKNNSAVSGKCFYVINIVCLASQQHNHRKNPHGRTNSLLSACAWCIANLVKGAPRQTSLYSSKSSKKPRYSSSSASFGSRYNREIVIVRHSERFYAMMFQSNSFYDEFEELKHNFQWTLMGCTFHHICETPQVSNTIRLIVILVSIKKITDHNHGISVN